VNRFQITTSAGIDLGTHVADSEIGALDTMARTTDAADFDAACERDGIDVLTWTNNPKAFAKGDIALLVVEVDRDRLGAST